MDNVVKIGYIGTPLPDNGETVVLFDNTPALGGNWMSMNGLLTLILHLVNSKSGTLNAYKRADPSEDWLEVDTQAVIATPANDSSFHWYVIGQMSYFKLEWVNGTTLQTAFEPCMALTQQWPHDDWVAHN